jgi:DNA-binding MarR family transcriptional regulator
MLKLTPRQQMFLDKLFELYRNKGPVHYSEVATEVGVNKFSAYDMLKVLEEKGVAASDYVLNDEQNGPGRSQVVFYPTHKAAQFLTQLREEMLYNADWQTVKESILKRLEDARQSKPVDAMRESLSNLPDTKVPLNYCAEMISVLMLNMERVRGYNLRPALDTMIKGRVGLGALVGLSLASTMTTDTEDTDDVENATLTEKLLAHSTRFQTQLADMSEESIAKLSSFVNDAMNVLNRASTT